MDCRREVSYTMTVLCFFGHFYRLMHSWCKELSGTGDGVEITFEDSKFTLTL